VPGAFHELKKKMELIEGIHREEYFGLALLQHGDASTWA